jgi:hypothetical protein
MIFLSVLIIFSSGYFFSCTEDNENKPKKSAIKEFTDHTAHGITRELKAPMIKAKGVTKAQEDRMKKVKKSLDE